MRGLLVRMGCWLVCLIPALALATGPGTGGTAEDLRAAADAALAQAQAAGPVAPANGPHAADINEANRQFLAWQREMLKQHQSLPPELQAILRKKSYVPPLVPGQPAPEPPSMKLDMPILPDPTGRLMPRLAVTIGAPTASLGIVAEGKAADIVGVSYKAGVSYATANNKWAFGDSADVKLGSGDADAELNGTYQFHASTWGNAAPEEEKRGGAGPEGTELSARFWQVKGTVGYNDAGELSVAAGYDLLKTPEAFRKFAALTFGVEGQVAAPVTGTLVGPKDRYGQPSVVASYAAKVARLLTSPVDCPYCGARGELHCPQCKDERTIVCTKCNGKLHYTCTRCEGGGQLYCGTCNHTGQVSCSSCRGSGHLRCSTCGGSGHVTVYESETRERQELVVDSLGFDEAGKPIYNRHYETRSYTEQVPKSQTCSSCSGSGDGGTCGTCGGDGKVTCRRCGGEGTVACGPCGGSGQVDCNRCRGTGKITCPTCDGKPINCPLCQGRKTIGGL